MYCTLKILSYLCIRVLNKGPAQSGSLPGDPVRVERCRTLGASGSCLVSCRPLGVSQWSVQIERAENPVRPVNIGSETLSNSGSVMAIVWERRGLAG